MLINSKCTFHLSFNALSRFLQVTLWCLIHIKLVFTCYEANFILPHCFSTLNVGSEAICRCFDTRKFETIPFLNCMSTARIRRKTEEFKDSYPSVATVTVTVKRFFILSVPLLSFLCHKWTDSYYLGDNACHHGCHSFSSRRGDNNILFLWFTSVFVVSHHYL